MSKLVDVVLPEQQEGTKAVVLRWCRNVGEQVVENEPLVELETDKVTVEVPSPATGELVDILKMPNDPVEPLTVLARVRTGAAAAGAVPRAAQASATQGSDAVAGESEDRALSPAVRRLLAEHRVDSAAIAGSGRNGRITAEDVLRHVERASTRAPAAMRPLPAEQRAPVRAGPGRRVPHTPIRRRIAEHMVLSVSTAPHVTTLFEADLTGVMEDRNRRAAEFAQRGVKLTLTSYFIAASVRGLLAVPEVNSTFHADHLEIHGDCNVGIGTALGKDGLIVPVVQRAQTLDLFGISQRLGELVGAARAGTLAPEAVRGGTFTISNHGVSGSILAAPIVINQPQVAILGVGKVERRVVAREIDGADAIRVRPMCYVTLTIDHRALDGFQANAFLATLVKTLEEWPAP